MMTYANSVDPVETAHYVTARNESSPLDPHYCRRGNDFE